ncbi:hypothetical protein IGI04_030406 [Brassica rapa subsp. trilocularis]|uniref:Arabidopsis retrotransposon Orf1 C-terminal domain-containing protein n=1 Tax=Brassica rapa subsp. trilocularis TaxID=1813537 RepID=A0ABQ7LS77_BRACM|nr:hypothetical protein IGI04_030406 [Brassica rapa subsp. trilocularis]
MSSDSYAERREKRTKRRHDEAGTSIQHRDPWPRDDKTPIDTFEEFADPKKALCRIYGLHEDAAAIRFPPFLGLDRLWEIIGTGAWNSNSATQTDIRHPTLRYFLRALANTLVCKMEPNKIDKLRFITDPQLLRDLTAIPRRPLGGDFQRVVLDVLRAIWARVSCTSRRTIRAHSPAAGRPSRQRMDPSSGSDDETGEDTN